MRDACGVVESCLTANIKERQQLQHFLHDLSCSSFCYTKTSSNSRAQKHFLAP